MMKTLLIQLTILLLFMLFLSGFALGQNPNWYKLDRRLKQLPQDTRVQVSQVEKEKVVTTDTVQASRFTPILASKAVVTYDNTIKKDNVAKLSLPGRLKAKYKDALIIPELYVEQTGEPATEGDVPGPEAKKEIIYYPIVTGWHPLVYSDSVGRFRSQMSFVVTSEDSDAKFDEPVRIEIESTDLGIKPKRIEIDHLDLPSTSVELSASDIRDSVEIRLITKANVKGYVNHLAVRPLLELNVNRHEIQGLGIQEIPIVVKFRGSSRSDQEEISLTPSQGTVTPATFPLRYNETKTVYLRSEGLEDIELKAVTSSNFNEVTLAGPILIRQEFPWYFLVFSLIGGLLGAMIRYFFKPERKRKFPTKAVVGGALIGLFGAIIYFVLGINLMNLELSATFNEFAVMGFSGLCAYLGIR